MSDEIEIKDAVLLEDEESEVVPKKEANEDIVEIVKDEAKPEDKGKKFVRTNEEEEVTEEELKNYSEDVQKRIRRLTWKSSNERRGREQAERDRDEAVRIATILLEEKKKADTARGEAETLSNKSTSERITVALAAAQQKLEDAFETFDGKAAAAAQAEIAQLMVQKERAGEWKPTNSEKNTGHEEQRRVDSAQTQTVSRPDPLAEAWARRNTWFQLDGYGRATNEETAFALKVHETLLGSGIHPILDSSEYYRKLDATLRANFPDHFADAPKGNTEKRPPAKASVVSGVTRSPTGTTKVRLTESQLRVARSLGVSPEDYAKSVAELTRS